MSEYVRTFNRFELKYRVHYKVARELMRLLQPHVRRDENAGDGGFYKVLSCYYDSPDLRCYWEKMDGEKYRRKVRVRTYGANPDQAFVEIKQRYNLNVQKRRMRAPIDQVERVMASIVDGTYAGGEHAVYDEVCWLARQYKLEPKLIVSYNRAAFFDNYKPDLRITLDRNIRCRNLDLDLRRHRMAGHWALPPQFLILEIKFNEVMPRWIGTCLNSLNLEIMRISKYCYGIDRCGMDQHTIEA